MEFRKKRVLGELLNDSFEFIRQNVQNLGAAIWRIAIPTFIVLNVGLTFCMEKWQGSVIYPKSDPKASSQEAIQQLSKFYISMFDNVWFWGIAIISMLLGVLIGGVYYVYIQHYVEGKSLEPAAIQATFFQRLSMLLTTSIGASVFGGMFIALTAVVNIVPCLGQMAWLSFTLFVLVMMSVILPLRMIEHDLRFFEAVERCRKLLKGQWWQSVALMLLSGLIMIALDFMFALPLQLYSALMGVAFSPEKLMGAAKIGVYIGEFISGCSRFVMILPVTAFFLQYFNLVERKEGTGMANRIDRI